MDNGGSTRPGCAQVRRQYCPGGRGGHAAVCLLCQVLGRGRCETTAPHHAPALMGESHDRKAHRHARKSISCAVLGLSPCRHTRSAGQFVAHRSRNSAQRDGGARAWAGSRAQNARSHAALSLGVGEDGRRSPVPDAAPPARAREPLDPSSGDGRRARGVRNQRRARAHLGAQRVRPARHGG